MLRITNRLRLNARIQSIGSISRMFAAAVKPPTGNVSPKKEVAKKASDLGSIVALELKEEEKIEEAANTDFEEVTKEVLTNFKLEVMEERALVRLTSEKGNEKHENDSDSQDMPEDEGEEGEEHNHEEEEGEGGENERNFGLDFSVKVTKNDQALSFNCTAYGDQLVINQVSLNREGMSEKELDNAYVGPLVDTLSEAMMEGFMKYLNKRNVNVDLCFFILHKAREVENSEYKGWLKRLLTFVNK